MATYAYLYPPEIQYQTKDGRNNTNGFLRVYLAATDDPATTYCDFNGTLNQQDIRLDDDGRAVVIVDNSVAYRLEVYDPEGALLFTCSPVTAVGGGGGSGANFVQVISTDGTVSVSSSTSAGTRYFDLSVAIDGNKPAKWADRTGTSTSITGDGEWHELDNWVDIGTTTYYNGWQMYTDAGYDVAGSLEMLSGDSDAVNSIDVRFLVTLDGVTEVEEFGRIDPTKDRDRVSFEWKGEGLGHQVVNARIFVRADSDMSVSLVSRACYNEEVDGIVGNGGAGGDYIAGEYIEIIGNLIQATGLQPLSGMSAYAYNSALSSKLDASASSQFYSTSNPSGFISNADISGKMDASASSEFYSTSNPSGFVTGGPYVWESAYSSFSSETVNNISSLSSMVSSISGQTGDFVEKSSISAESSKWNEVSGLSSKLDASASSNFAPTGDYAYNSSVSSKLDASSSSLFAPTGDYAYNSSVSSKLDSSASSDFYLTSNPSGFITSADASTSFVYNSSFSSFSSETTSNISSLSSIVSSISGQTGDFVEKSSISAESSKWNEVSGLSGKLDNSASSNFYPTSNPSGFVTGGPYAYESALSSKLDASASSEFMPATATGLFTGVVTDTSLSGNGMAEDPLGVTRIDLYWDTATMSSVYDGYGETAGVRTDVFQAPITYGYDGGNISSIDGSALAVTSIDSATVSSIASSIASSYSQSAASSKLDKSASSQFLKSVYHDNTLSGNGFYNQPLGVNKIDLVFDQTMNTSVADGDVVIGVNTDILSSYAYESALSGYYPTSNPSGFISSVDLSDYATTAYVDSSVSGKLDAAESSNFVLTSQSGAFQPSGDYLSATESSNYYPTSNPSGFITGVDLSDYATTAYVDSSVSGKQDVSGMTAYQLSGDYLSATESSNYYPMTGNPSGFLTEHQELTGYIPTSESANYYPTSNPSGFISGVDLTPYQQTANMTAYIPVSALGTGEL